MTASELQPRVLKALHSAAEVTSDPTPEESLFDSGLLDSFSLNDLVLELEKEFAITIPDGDISARRFDSVEKISQYVATKAR